MSQQSRTQQTPKVGSKVNPTISMLGTTDSTSTVVTPKNGTKPSTKSSSKPNKATSGGRSEDSNDHIKDKIPEWQLNIKSFFAEKQNKKRKCDSDDDTIEIVEQNVNDTKHSPSSDCYPSPPHGLGNKITNILMGEEENEDDMWDPRGFRSMKRLMPSTYCPLCRCPERQCHNRVFGPYCELHILHEVYNADYPLDTIRMESLYRDRYNDALQFKIYEQTTTLDVTPIVGL